jgi:hypothetical protein
MWLKAEKHVGLYNYRLYQTATSYLAPWSQRANEDDWHQGG